MRIAIELVAENLIALEWSLEQLVTNYDGCYAELITALQVEIEAQLQKKSGPLDDGCKQRRRWDESVSQSNAFAALLAVVGVAQATARPQPDDDIPL